MEATNARRYAEPRMRDLLNHVVPSLNEKWSHLGYELLEAKDSDIIKEIEGNIQGNVKLCAQNLFEKWLELGYKDTTWNKVIEALKTIKMVTLAQKIAKKLLPVDPDDETNGNDEADSENQVGLLESSGTVKPKVPVKSSRPKQVKRKLDDTDGERSTTSVKRPKSNMKIDKDPLKATSRVSDESSTTAAVKKLDDTDGGRSTASAKHPKSNMKSDKVPSKDNGVTSSASNKSSATAADDKTTAGGPAAYPPTDINKIKMMKYREVNKRCPAFAIILNNKNFDGQKERKGTDEDEINIRSLKEKFKGMIVFHEYTLKDLTADEIKGAFKMLATNDPTSLSSTEVEGALKLFDEDESTTPVDKKRIRLKKFEKIDFKKYSCFMAFIMSHGNEKGITGKDGNQVEIETLSSFFTPDQCEGLKDKPKIFFIQACRGSQKDVVGVMDDISYPAPTDDIIPKEADFLYVYATTKSYGASRHPTAGSLFIQTLIEVMEQTLGCYHLEEILLFVKSEMGRKRIKVSVKDDKNKDKVVFSKQIVSVVSQLRDPRDWSRNHVTQWLQHVAVQYKLGHTFPERCLFNGKALSILTKGMFEYRAPDEGALVYEDVQLKLKKAAGDQDKQGITLQLPGKQQSTRTTA